MMLPTRTSLSRISSLLFFVVVIVSTAPSIIGELWSTDAALEDSPVSSSFRDDEQLELIGKKSASAELENDRSLTCPRASWADFLKVEFELEDVVTRVLRGGSTTKDVTSYANETADGHVFDEEVRIRAEDHPAAHSDSDGSTDESVSTNAYKEDVDEKGGARFLESPGISSIRQRFLDRIRVVSQALLSEPEAQLDHPDNWENPEAITPQSDLARPGRHITIVTTAALPWMTGTAVNPLLRAAYLHRYTQSINYNPNNPSPSSYVRLVIPWLELKEDRDALYGPKHSFHSPEEQEQFVRQWLREEAGMPDAADGLDIVWYQARFHSELTSIFAMGDIVATLRQQPQQVMDVCLLEEPEHLNWYRAPGDGWTQAFDYVVGIVHTNYRDYASTQYHGLWTSPAIALISSAMVRAHCHKVIKLSAVLQTFAPEKEATSNVHGVRSDFLQSTSTETLPMSINRNAEVYFIGKIIWQKGLDLMLDLQDYYKQATGSYFEIDIYGSGPDERAIRRAFLGRSNGKQDVRDKTSAVGTVEPSEVITGEDASGEASEDESRQTESVVYDDPQVVLSTESPTTKELNNWFQEGRTSLEALQSKAKQQLEKIRQTIKETTESLESIEVPKTLHELRRQQIPATFPGRVDHAALRSAGYRAFVNPSVTEVLCTTTAEALAMGNFAIIPHHPSNMFFLQFPNCLAYRNKFEFVANLRWALTHEPEPLSPEMARAFTWEAATERLMKAAAVTYREAWEREQSGWSKLDERIAWFHNEISKGKSGDRIRAVLGAGPAASQVKYQRQQQERLQQQETYEDVTVNDIEDEGFGSKFHLSALTEAIRSTVAKGLPSLRPKASNP